MFIARFSQLSVTESQCPSTHWCALWCGKAGSKACKVRRHMAWQRAAAMQSVKWSVLTLHAHLVHRWVMVEVPKECREKSDEAQIHRQVCKISTVTYSLWRVPRVQWRVCQEFQVWVTIFHTKGFFSLKILVNHPGIGGREVAWTDLHILMITLDADKKQICSGAATSGMKGKVESWLWVPKAWGLCGSALVRKG